MIMETNNLKTDFYYYKWVHSSESSIVFSIKKIPIEEFHKKWEKVYYFRLNEFINRNRNKLVYIYLESSNEIIITESFFDKNLQKHLMKKDKIPEVLANLLKEESEINFLNVKKVIYGDYQNT